MNGRRCDSCRAVRRPDSWETAPKRRCRIGFHWVATDVERAAMTGKGGWAMGEAKHNRSSISERAVEAANDCGTGGLCAEDVVMGQTGNQMPTFARILKIPGTLKWIVAARVVPDGGSSTAAAQRWKVGQAPGYLNAGASFGTSLSRDISGKTRGPPTKM